MSKWSLFGIPHWPHLPDDVAEKKRIFVSNFQESLQKLKILRMVLPFPLPDAACADGEAVRIGVGLKREFAKFGKNILRSPPCPFPVECADDVAKKMMANLQNMKVNLQKSAHEVTEYFKSRYCLQKSNMIPSLQITICNLAHRFPSPSRMSRPDLTTMMLTST